MTPGSNGDFVRLLPNDAVREIRKSKLLPKPVMDNEKGEQGEQRFPGLEGDKVDGAKDYIIDFIKVSLVPQTHITDYILFVVNMI